VLDQQTGLPPSCPAGDTLIFSTEITELCGACLSNHVPGQREVEYATCSSTPQRKKPIQSLCVAPCDLQ
jgi:hypothetical protein